MRREPELTKQPSIPFVGHRPAARRFVRSNEASARADPLPRHGSGGLVGLARAGSPVWADAVSATAGLSKGRFFDPHRPPPKREPLPPLPGGGALESRNYPSARGSSAPRRSS